MKPIETCSMDYAGEGTYIKLNNYDVVLLPSIEGEPLYFAPGNFVGNQRFLVILSLFRQQYLQARMFGDEYECNSIAEEVLETISQKCVPNGRFFERGHYDQFEQYYYDSSSTINMIRKALKSDPEGDFVEEPAPKTPCQGSNSSGFELLYEAASKDLWPAPPREEAFVKSPNPFDVVCETNGLGMCMSQDRQYTGNNRLKIMIQIRLERYKKSTPKGKQEIADEVVSSIIEDASAYFLIVDKVSMMYKNVSRTSAVACVKTALDAATNVCKKKLRDYEIKQLVQRKTQKDIYDRLVQKRKEDGKNGKRSFSQSSMPTTFNALQRNTIVSRAA